MLCKIFKQIMLLLNFFIKILERIEGYKKWLLQNKKNDTKNS